MANNISAQKVKMKSKTYTEFINEMVDNPELLDKLPDRAVIYDHTNINIWREVSTPKRMELFKIIEEKNPRSISELARLTGRKKENVHRDLKLLQDHGLVKIKKHKHTAEPKIVKRAAIINLM